MDIGLNGQIWLRDVKLADDFKSRFLGYMFQKEPEFSAILFEKCDSIHMFFMHFSIDVLFLDREMKVLRKVTALKKRKMIFPVKNAWYVLEAPAGHLDKARPGDTLHIL